MKSIVKDIKKRSKEACANQHTWTQEDNDLLQEALEAKYKTALNRLKREEKIYFDVMEGQAWKIKSLEKEASEINLEDKLAHIKLDGIYGSLATFRASYKRAYSRWELTTKLIQEVERAVNYEHVRP
jgi:hypothetical protein